MPDRIATHIHVLLAIYTPSMEIKKTRSSERVFSLIRWCREEDLNLHELMLTDT